MPCHAVCIPGSALETESTEADEQFFRGTLEAKFVEEGSLPWTCHAMTSVVSRVLLNIARKGTKTFKRQQPYESSSVLWAHVSNFVGAAGWVHAHLLLRSESHLIFEPRGEEEGSRIHAGSTYSFGHLGPSHPSTMLLVIAPVSSGCSGPCALILQRAQKPLRMGRQKSKRMNLQLDYLDCWRSWTGMVVLSEVVPFPSSLIEFHSGRARNARITKIHHLMQARLTLSCADSA
ncbi:unnamed protein product [Symbiodinium natans]|uniref:Uncharacterized protein n=1 Tax=Symbiodinium natans TaxID=878477 RepID=A0A812JB39_9DINO|nr:unnamed protein product [Symbiodinium natans]